MSDDQQTNDELIAKWEKIDQRLNELANSIDLIITKMENVEHITHQMCVSMLQAFNEGVDDVKRKP